MPLLDLTDKELTAVKLFFTEAFNPKEGDWDDKGKLTDPEMQVILDKMDAAGYQ